MTRLPSLSAALVLASILLLSSVSTTSAFVPASRLAARQATSSFTGQDLRTARISKSNRSSSKQTTQLCMVIESLSDDCIAAVKEGHDIGNEIGMTTLSKELLFAGIVRHPERARKTLNKYGVDSDEAKSAAVQVVKYAPGVTLQNPPAPEERKPLPFAADSKLILSRAVAIAESMESSVTRSEHVLLALMGYNNGNKIDNSPIIDILGKMKSISRTDSGFKVFNFCDDLINDLPMTPVDKTTVERETVVIGGGEGTTNTLAEVGVDMTQLAMEGKYDAVFGRDNEIKSVLRTLGRRRKNNPCLIGGKKILV